MPDFLLPDLGEGLTEADIVNWLVEVGDEVALDQPVVEVETAKAVVEVPVPYAGTVTAVHGRPGQSLAVGSPLITIGADPGARGPHDRGAPSHPDGNDSGNVLIGYGTPQPGPRRQRARSVEATAKSTVASIEPTAPAGSRTVISPVVRALARNAGLDLTTVRGTGTDGVVCRRDVEQAIRRRTEPDRVRRIPMTGVRRLVADKMSRSRREIPEATVWVDVDATDLLAARDVINGRQPEQVSILALIARFALLGLRRFPELNGRIEGSDILLPDRVHLGVAAQTDRGLVVPVIHSADLLTTTRLSAAIAERASAARAGALTPHQLSGGTFTVNNYGVFGVDGSAAIINYPEVAILGLGRIIDRPWVVDGAVVARKVAQLSLVFDHRVCDGGVAGGFLRFVADCVETPLAVLAEV